MLEISGQFGASEMVNYNVTVTQQLCHFTPQKYSMYKTLQECSLWAKSRELFRFYFDL